MRIDGAKPGDQISHRFRVGSCTVVGTPPLKKFDRVLEQRPGHRSSGPSLTVCSSVDLSPEKIRNGTQKSSASHAPASAKLISPRETSALFQAGTHSNDASSLGQKRVFSGCWVHSDGVRARPVIAREGHQRIATNIKSRDHTRFGRDEQVAPRGVHRQHIWVPSDGRDVHYLCRAQVKNRYPAVLLARHVDQLAVGVDEEPVRMLDPRHGDSNYD
jgi:hypothetical protein